MQALPKYAINELPAWSKAFLIVFWIVQLIVCIVGWGIGACALGTESLLQDHATSYSSKVQSALRYEPTYSTPTMMADEYRSVGAAIWIAWASGSFVLIVTEIVMFSRQTLKPWFEFTSCCIKTTLWLIMFLIAIRDMVVDGSSGLSLLILGLFLTVFLIPLIYSAVVLHRQRRAQGIDNDVMNKE
ncbi:unnamed protein product [Aureobasidium vineae]|uniref:Uncharacterized protein n=1 Tax=Aureobasidium vineae TaxID=2773715 RepID=A0A9N8P657_9PEZI|nr:unnamed protein product [Aureobasidium vineae]